MQTKVTIVDRLPNQSSTLILGFKSTLINSDLWERFNIPQSNWKIMLSSLHSGSTGSSTTTWIEDRKLTVAVLPSYHGRHNSPSYAWIIPSLISSFQYSHRGEILAVVDERYRRATAIAIAKAFPEVNLKKLTVKREILLEICDEPLINYNLQVLVNATRYAAQLFDMPPNMLRVSHFVKEAKKVAQRTQTKMYLWERERLKKEGFGGILGVGQGSSDGPAFVVLHRKPENARHKIAWVGKGIVYDTGGLSIKSKTGMPSMKGDMGGAAAVIAAFEAAELLDAPYELFGILCLAENSVGPDSIRPDDVLNMFSGKTVEVNNTDAEGRLVLADGVHWASKQNCDVIIDIATLTGAAPAAVGTHFAAIYCNDETLEQCAVQAGRFIGELCHPLPYTPELYFHEFYSAIADMKNSVKNRANAQSACAGQFIGNHLPQNQTWLHIDIAGPAWGTQKRGTGFGVGLLLHSTQNWISSQ